MDPAPPSEPRGKSRPKSRRHNKELPFYEAPGDVKTSAQIVHEAKQELLARQNRDKLRGAKSSRPFTPRDEERKLYAPSDRPVSSLSLDPQLLDELSSDLSRPPSAVSLSSSNSHRFPVDSASRASSASSSRALSASSVARVRLEPISGDDSVNGAQLPKPTRPPSGDPRRKPRVRSAAQQSQPTPTAGDTPTTARSGSCGDLKAVDEKVVGGRRVHSGPKERTTLHSAQNSLTHRRRSADHSMGERGEGDGQEVSPSTRPPRDVSSAGEKGLIKNTEYVESTIQSLLDKLKSANLEESVICATCHQIYRELDSAHLLGKASGQRTHILKAVFKLLERKNPASLLSLASLALALRVSGRHLTTVCKVVFKVSLDKTNDQLFISTKILELLYDTMISIDSEQSADAQLYCCGVVKNLAGNNNLSDILSGKCTLYTLATVLARLNKLVLDSSRPNDKLVQVLGQLTSALRKFAEQAAFISQFVAHSVVDELCVTSVACSTEYELMVNICSTLGKLTEHKSCCESLSKHPTCYKSLLKLLSTYTHKEDLVSRICFVLGTLADQDEEARLALCQEKDSMTTLMAAFDHYLQLSLKDSSDAGAGSRQAVNEVLTKLIRVIANLTISEAIGTSLSDDKRCVEYLLHILDVKDISGHEELVLTTMVAMNNLTFYTSPGTVMQENEVDASRCLMKLLLKDHKEGLAEVCRIYGNLTRSRLVRDFLAANTVLEIMVTLLDSGDQDLVYFCCGVLVNFMLDEDKRPVLKREGGIVKLIDVLRDFATMDWSLAGLVCQVLWNYSTNIRSTNNTFGEDESQQLVSLLTDYIDNAHLPAKENSTNEMRRYLHDTWRMDFCSVAAQLRKRIKSYQSKLVELSPPTSAC